MFNIMCMDELNKDCLLESRNRNRPETFITTDLKPIKSLDFNPEFFKKMKLKQKEANKIMEKFYNDVVIVQLLNNMEKQEIKIAPKVKTWEERLDSARKQIEVEKCL